MTLIETSKVDRRAALGMLAIPLLGAAPTGGVAADADKTSRPPPKGKKNARTVVETQRHVIGPKLAAKMAEAGLFNPKLPFPQTNPLDFVCYRDFIDLDYAMLKQRKVGVTLSVASNGGEMEWIAHRPAGRPSTNKRLPCDYFKTNIRVDTMGFNPIGVHAAVEMCEVDRVVFGSDFGAIPYGIEEHTKIVEDVLSSADARELAFWKTKQQGLPSWPGSLVRPQPASSRG